MALKVTENDLIEDGFTRRFAQIYLNNLEKENLNPKFNKDFLEWAHEKGFYAKNALSIGVSENNYQEYVSDYNWCKMWPLNGWQRIWANDKLTFKYLMAGTEYNDLMPEYYFYMTNKGLRELIDNPHKGSQDVDTLLSVLKEKGSLAAKPNNGALSSGFIELKYLGGDSYTANGEEISESELKKLISGKANYIYTEFLSPCEPYKSIDSRIHRLRMIVLNEHGNDPIICGGASIRFANPNYEGANYVQLDTNSKQDAYNLYVQLNTISGEFNGGKKVYGTKKAEETKDHPVTGIPLKGKIEDYDKLVQSVLGISSWLFGLTWLGFDLCMSEQGVKVIEINTHPAMLSSQIFMPIRHDQRAKDFIENHLKEIGKLSEGEKMQRVSLAR